MCKSQLLSKKKPMITILLLNQGRVCVWVGEITIFWWRGLCLATAVVCNKCVSKEVPVQLVSVCSYNMENADGRTSVAEENVHV